MDDNGDDGMKCNRKQRITDDEQASGKVGEDTTTEACVIEEEPIREKDKEAVFDERNEKDDASTTDSKEESSMVGDDKGMRETEPEKGTINRMDENKREEDVCCEASNDKDAVGERGRKSRRKREQHQKYKADTWLTEFHETCGDISPEEDSYDDKTWSPAPKTKKVYTETSASDDEDPIYVMSMT